MSTRAKKHADKWVKRGIQLPEPLASEWQLLTHSHGELKILGTGAVGLMTAMPEKVRESIELFVLRENRVDPARITSQAIWTVFENAMREHGHWPSTTPAAATRNEIGDDDEYCPRTVLRNPIKRRATG